MRSTSTAVTLALATATILGGFFLGRLGGPAIPTAMAQSGGACCGTPAPVSSVLADAPLFTLRDPALDKASQSSAAVCATPAMSTSGYRTLIVHVANCSQPFYAQYSLGQAGFVTQATPQLACTTSTTSGVRGSAIELDATLGTSFRLATPALKTGACPTTDVKVTVAGVR
jgi:hypothetical protein